MKAAFIYVNAGKGHYIPAKAMYDTYIEQGYGEAVLENLFVTLNSKKMDKMVQQNWRYWLKHPMLQPYAYPIADKNISGKVLRKFLNNKKHMSGLSSWLEREKPDLIVSTNFLGGLILPDALEKLNVNIPVYQYAADCVATPVIGVNNKLEKMYLATEVGIKSAISVGMNKNKVKLCPFPLQYKMEHSERLSKEDARKKIGLDNIFTIAYSVGGEGICRLGIIEEVDARGKEVQFILLGKMSDRTQRELKRILKRLEHVKVIAPGFVDNIYDYFYASDITMGKAGANSVMESIYLERYTIVSDSLYPFENARALLEDNHIGCVENSIKKQADIIMDFYERPEKFKESSYENIGITFSSKAFIEMLLEDYENIH